MEKRPLLSVDEIVARITSGEPIDSLVKAMLPDGHQDVLKRATLVRSFDRDLYDSVLAAGSDEAPAFEKIVMSDDLESLPGITETYQLRSTARRRWFKTWWSDADPSLGPSVIPSDLREVAASLVDYYRAAESPIDELASLVFVDQAQAQDLFNRLFDGADMRFDLARCQDVLDAVAASEQDRNRLLEPAFKDDVDARVLRLRARTLWADDWYRTARFLEPAGLRAPFEALLSGEPSRFLQIHARGGMGKTMRLRWLISRWLVPEGIPVTRIDFDTADPLIAISDPWLLLVDAARQLTEQLPLGPFTELTKDFGKFMPLLYRSSQGAQEAAKEFAVTRGWAAENVLTRFIVGINESAGNQPVMMIFDTMEELLFRQTDLVVWTNALRRIHESCPAIRLLFSGRYEIDEKIPGFSASFPNMVSEAVKPFSDEEATTYLATLRRIENPALVNETVRLADGLPFKLTLFADVLLQRPDLKAEHLQDYRNQPELLYLIERVIERIPSYSVRWLLRYGVIPRVLDRRVLMEFLIDYIRRGISGDPTFDEPGRDSLPRSRSGQVQMPFPTIIQDPVEFDPDVLWERLRSYAASSSWVRIERADVVRFHPDVVNPMRRILRTQPAYEKLNADFRQYFSKLAWSEPELWGVWMTDAVHHAFQLEGNAAVPFWEEAIQEASRRGRYDWRRLLAALVIDREAIGLQGERIAPDDGSVLLDLAVLSRATFEMAASYAEEARDLDANAAHPLWSQARSYFAMATAPDADPSSIPVVSRALLSTAILRRDVSLPREDRLFALRAATTELQRIRNLAREAAEWATVNAALTQVFIDLGDLQSANTVLQEALAADPEWVSDPNAQRARRDILRVARRLVQANVAADRLDLAGEVVAYATPLATQMGPTESAELSRLDAMVLLSGGEPALAESRLDQTVPDKSALREWIPHELMRARLRIAALHPMDAVEILRKMLPYFDSGSPPGISLDEAKTMQAELQEVLGEAYGAVGEFRRAGAAYDIAHSLWSVTGSIDRAASAACLAAALQFHGAGDLRQATQFLDAAESHRLEPGSEPWTTARLLRAELLVRLGERSRADLLLAEVGDALERSDAPPRQWIRLALTALSIGDDDPQRWGRILQDQFERIQPPESRLRCAEGFARVPQPAASGERHLVEQLMRLLVEERFRTWETLIEQDRQVQTLTLIELTRVAGHRETAGELLRNLLPQIDESSDPFMLVRALEAADRLGDDGSSLLDEARLNRLRSALAMYPTIESTVLITQARGLAASRPLRARELVDRAEILLEQADEQPITLQAALFDLRATIDAQLGRESLASYTSQRATELRAQLGWSRGEPVASEDNAIPRATVAADLYDRIAIGVTLTLPGDRRDYPRQTAADNSFVGDILGFDPGRGSGPVEALSANLIARIGGDWWRFGQDLGALAFHNAWPAIPEPLDLVLQIRHRRLAAIPWEILRSPRDELLSLDERVRSFWRGSDESSARSTEARAVQGVLNALSPRHEIQFDGIMGPITRDAIVKFQTAVDIPATGLLDTATTAALRQKLVASNAELRPHAIIVRPTFGSQRTRLRGEYREGSDIAFEYQVSGFQVHVLEDASLQELRDVITRHALSNEGPAILHLSAGITISSGTLSLDFGGDTGFTKSSRPRDGELFTATSLDRLIQANRRSAWGPIVVLDVPRPTGHFEAQRLLLLRNLFATDLFQLGGSSAVIAAGLAEFESSRARARLLHALGAGGSLADAVRDVRDLSHSVRDDRDGFTEALAFASTALFTDVPWMGAFAP